jgi:PKHD-type hydroxylase
MYTNAYWTWEAEIPEAMCTRFIGHFNDELAQKGGINAEGKEITLNADIRETDLVWISSGEIFDCLFRYIQSANINGEWKFDLSGMEDVQLGRYSVDGHYGWHIDGDRPCAENFQRKLSCSLQLSDPDSYEGGDLVLRLNDRETYVAPRKQGTIIVFPSFREHQVTPVTSGVRYSAVGWMRGPAFR